MSNDIDNKVVTMTFDNAKFAQKMEETIKGLDNLNKSLKMVEGVKGMADAQKQVNSFKMDGVSKAVSDAQAQMGKFNASPVVNAVADAQGAVNKFDGSNMGDQADKISAKWVAMAAGIFAVVSGLVTQIGSKFASIGQGFTLGPLKDGFSEYQTNVGAIQTILANTDRFGTKLPEVTANLDELNTYSDKTIYNFGEMVKNIGLFTNAGIQVGDATSMIKGFSNAAAASGTTAEGAAGAAYQLSQALSNGTIRLMDWRSLSNVGMGNKNMQQGIIELADSMGTLDKAGLSSEEVTAHFTDTLEKGWLSADVMSNYLKIMAGDMDDAQLATLGLDKTQIDWFKRQQKIAEESATKVRTFTQLVGTVKESIGSGWSETFRTVIGDFEGATTLFTGINNTISGIVGKSAQARNDLLRGWDFLGGRSAMLEGFVRIWAALLAVMQPVQKAFRSVFPKTTVTQLATFSDRFRNFTKMLMPAKNTISAISSVFKGFFSIIKIGTSIIWEVGKLVISVFKDAFGGTVRSGIVPFAASIGNIIFRLQEFLIKGGRLKAFFAGLRSAIHHVLGPFKGLMQIFIAIGKVVATVFGSAFGLAIAAFRKLFGLTDKAKGAGKSVGGFLDKITRAMIYAVRYINDFNTKLKHMGDTFDKVKTFFMIGFKNPFRESKLDGALGLVVKIGQAFGKVMAGVKIFVDHITKVFGPAVNAVKIGFVTIKEAIQSAIQQFKNGSMTLKQAADQVIGTVIGVFGNLGKVLSDLAGTIGAKASEIGKAIIDGVSNTINSHDWLGMLSDVGHKLYESFMSAIDAHSPSRMFADAALAIPQGIAEGIKNGWNAIKDAVGWVGDKLRDIMGVIVDVVTSPKLTTALKNGGLFALVKMVLNVSGIFKGIKDATRQFKNSMKSVTGAMDQAKDTLKTYQKSIKWNVLRKIAISIGLLTASMIAMSFIDPAKLAQGAAGVGAAMVGIVTSMRQLDHVGGTPDKLNAIATTIRKIAEAILILAFAVKLLGDMKDRGNLAQGLAGVYILMAGMAGAVKLLDGQTMKMEGVAATLLGLATALLILTFSVKTLGKMNDKGDLAQGLLAVVLLLGGLGSAIGVMGEEETKMAGVAISLVALGVALLLVARAVKSMSKLKGDEIKRGLLGLAGGLLIILGAMAFMQKMELEKAGLGLLLMSYGLKGIAKVVELFSKIKGGDLAKGMAAFAVMMGVVAAAVYAMEGGLAGAASLLVAAFAIKVLSDVIVGLSKLKFGDIAKGIGALVLALLAIGLTMAVLGLASPLIAAFGLALLVAGVGMLAFGAGVWLLAAGIKNLVDAGSKGIDLFMKAFDTFVSLLPHWLGVLGDAVVEGIKHFLSGTPELIDMLGIIIGKLLDMANKNLPKFFEVIHNIIQGLIQIIKDSQEGWVQAGLGLLEALMNGLGENSDKLTESAVQLLLDFMDSLATAIEDHSEEVGDAGRRLAKAILDGMINVLLPESMQEAIGNLVSGMIDWFKNLLGIHSPSTVFSGFGGDILQGLIDGLGGMVGSVLNFFTTLPGKIIGALGDLLSLLWQKGSDLISGLWNGAKAIWNSVSSWIAGIGGRVLSVAGNLLNTLVTKGSNLISGLKNGITGAWYLVTDWVSKIPSKIRSVIANPLTALSSTGKNIVEGLKNGISGAWDAFVNWFKSKISSIPVIGDKILKILSPSRRFMWTGNMIVAGLRKGMADVFPHVYKDVKSHTGKLMDAMNQGVSAFNELGDINPTIAPVIDLTNVKMGVDAISSMMDGASIDAGMSLDNARTISAATSTSNEQAAQTTTTTPGGVTFIQNIHSPRALSEADIYRNTNGQVARASKELGIAS